MITIGRLFVFLALAVTVRAHSVWIEELDGKLVIRFGEPGENSEKSPGYLDSLGAVTAWTQAEGKAKPFVVSKKADHFLIEQAEPKQGVEAETSFPVRKTAPDKPARKPFFYARWQPAGLTAAATPALMLDLTPTGQPDEVRVVFRGKPLPEAKLTLHLPSGGERELTADAQGLVKLGDIKADGFYLLECPGHSEPIPGFSGGTPYDIASHNSALAWRQGAK